MHLLDRAEYRLGAYLAKFSTRSNPETNSALIKPMSAEGLDTRKQINALQKAMNAGATDADVRAQLADLVALESKAREVRGLSPLASLQEQANRAEAATRNSPSRLQADGTYAPLKASTAIDSRVPRSPSLKQLENPANSPDMSDRLIGYENQQLAEKAADTEKAKYAASSAKGRRTNAIKTGALLEPSKIEKLDTEVSDAASSYATKKKSTQALGLPLASPSASKAPTYLSTDADGFVDIDSYNLNPKRATGLDRRRRVYDVLEQAVLNKDNPNYDAVGKLREALPGVQPTKAPTLLESLKGKAASTVTAVKKDVQRRNDRVKAMGTSTASAASSPIAPPAAAPATSPSTPAPAPPTKAKKSKGFKGKVTTPKGVYKAELDVPDWVKGGAKGTSKATTVKPVKIANTIRDGNLLSNVKDYYKNLSPSTKKAALGGGLALGGLGLLAAGSNKAARDRGAQEARTRELAAIAARPPALPENQLPYSPYGSPNPYDYQGY